MSNTFARQAQSAILVDYDMYSRSPRVQRWVEQRENKAALVMLVTNPVYADFDPEHPRHSEGPEFAAVLRNTGALPDLAFKTSALCVIQDMSNLLPVVTLDDDYAVQAMYREGGALVTLYEKDLHYDE